MLRALKANAFALICAVIICAGLGRALYLHLVLDPIVGSPAPIDARYAALKDVLPAEPVFAYVSDSERDRLYQQASYSLAPAIFADPGQRPLHAIANLHDPAKLDELCRAGGWRPQAIFEGGAVALLERKP